MRKAILVLLSAAALVLAPSAASSGGEEPRGGPPGEVPVCLVTEAHPDQERTIEVPAFVATVLTRVTLSYAGACAEYGESAPRGEGTLTAYSQVWQGEPQAVGLVFPSETLQGLPYDPPTAGLWCYDKDGNGEVDPMMECSGGYEDALHLGEDFRTEVDSPFTYVLTNWNPMGHMPPGIYDTPHFDVHFYTNPNEERLAIRPGPCDVLVHCDDYPLGKNLPEARYLHPDFQDLNAIEPAMGNHLTDLTGPEHNGEPFTHTFIYGTWDGEVTFYEPMVTHEWYSGLSEGTLADGCFPIKQPEAFQEAGWYPTEYCTRYRENRDELTTSLEGFAYHEAG
ncbi:hypothetical protein [Ornithinimicrobium cavernae]|uniref:hypothetical protein n=1 Tax=Ornithinimicrobium cavernae TaxID=2666047 RepID=UPI000D685EDC|nr:hypothetical protein [Ornithinimicrobium cavernae]